MLSGLAHRQITPYAARAISQRQLENYCNILSLQKADEPESEAESTQNIKTTVLHNAIINQRINVTSNSTAGSTETTIKEILSSPSAIATVNAHDSVGYTPLHWAAYSNNIAAIRLLLEHGADIHTQDIAGNTPLYVALVHGNIDCATLLIRHFDVGRTAIPKWTSLVNKRGMSPLIPAAQHAYIPADTLSGLLMHIGGDSMKDINGWTVLHYMALAARTTEPKDDKYFTQLRSKIDIICGAGGLLIDECDNSGQSPLMFAIRHSDDPSFVREMLKRGADVTLSDAKGGTVLHYLARYATGKTMEVFLEDLEQTADDTQVKGGRKMGREFGLGGMNPNLVGSIVPSIYSSEGDEKYARTPEGLFQERRILSASNGLDNGEKLIAENDVLAFERLLRRIRKDARKGIENI